MIDQSEEHYKIGSVNIKHEADSSRPKCSINLTMVIWGIATLSVFLLGFFSIRSFINDNYAFEKKIVKLELNGGIIGRLDESLTMSVKMAALTGELGWEKRYRIDESAYIKTESIVKAILPKKYQEKSIDQSKNAATALFRMENQAFDLVRKAQKEKAYEILSSHEYKIHKGILLKGLQNLHSYIQEYINEQTENRKEKFLQFVLVLGIILTLIWVGTYFLMNRFITKQKQAEEKLKQTLDKLSNIQFALDEHTIVAITDPEGKITYANDKFCQVSKYSRDELLGQDHRIINSGYHPKEFIKGLWDTIKQGKVWKGIIKNKAKDNTFFWLDSTIVPFLDDQGKPYQYVTIRTDITDRKNAEQALKEQNDELLAAETELQKLSRAVEQSANTIVITDLNGNIEFVNPAFTKKTGYTYEEAIGQNPSILKSGKTDSKIYEELWKTITGGKVWEGELINKRKNGELYWEEIKISPLKDQNGNITHYLAVKDDITKRKQMETALQKAIESAEKANQAKSEFLANMSHEIRTPMNAILGFSEILSSKLKDDQNKQYLSSIQSSGKTLLTLINDILDLSKVEAGKLTLEYTAVNPHSIFNEMKQIFSQKLADKNLNFFIEIDPKLPDALILDEARLRQVLLNIIGNAVKFTESGYIKLSVSTINPDADNSKLDLKFSIEDTGIGIADDQKDTIFGAFEQHTGQSQKQFSGTGLGLAITKRLIELMNGKISLESKLGRGTTFSIIIKNVDVASGIEVQEDDLPYDINTIQFDPAKILIVDDIAYNREILKSYLDYPELTLFEAENGKEAIDIAKQFQPDLILMDMKMPVMGGYEATKIMKSTPELKSIPIIIVTASTRKETEEAIAKLCDSFLRKPISKSKLMKSITEYLSHSITEIETEILREPEDIEITPEMAEKLPELLSILDSKMKTSWEKISDVHNISNIKDFAKEMMILANEYKYQPIKIWAKNLESHAQMFNTDGITKTLKDYPNLVETLKTSITDN